MQISPQEFKQSFKVHSKRAMKKWVPLRFDGGQTLEKKWGSEPRKKSSSQAEDIPFKVELMDFDHK